MGCAPSSHHKIGYDYRRNRRRLSSDTNFVRRFRASSATTITLCMAPTERLGTETNVSTVTPTNHRQSDRGCHSSYPNQMQSMPKRSAKSFDTEEFLSIQSMESEETKESSKDRFFHNLFAYLDAKKKFDEGFDAILQKDPEASEELLKTESFNDVAACPQKKKDGNVPLCYGDLEEVAKKILKRFERELRTVCVKAGFNSSERLRVRKDKTRLQIAPLKSEERAAEKVKDDYDGDYSKLTDVARASIMCQDVRQLKRTLDAIKDDNSMKLVRLKNRFAPENALFTGYRDLLALVYVEDGAIGHVCEVQLHLEEILTKKEESHNTYEYFRTYFCGDISSMVDRMKLLHDVSKRGATGLEQLIEEAQSWKEIDRLNCLVVLLNKMAVYDLAENIAQVQVRVAKDRYGPNHATYAASLTNYGKVLLTRHKCGRAAEVLAQAYQLNKKIHAADPSHLVTLESMTDYARVLLNQGNRSKEALSLFTEAYTGKLFKLGATHLSTLTTQKDLADALRLEKRYGEAEKTLKRVLKLLPLHGSAGKSEMNHATHTLASVLGSLGKVDEAEEMLRKSIKDKERMLGVDHPDTHVGRNNLAILLLRTQPRELHEQDKRSRKKLEEALSLSKRALNGLTNHHGELHPLCLSSMNTFGNCLHRLGKFDEAEKHHRFALEGATKIFEKTGDEARVCRRNLIEVLKESSSPTKRKEAKELFVLNLSTKFPDDERNSPGFADGLRSLAIFIQGLGDTYLREAERHLNNACVIYSKHPSCKVEHFWTTIELMKNWLAQEINLDRAEQTLLKACKDIETVGIDHTAPGYTSKERCRMPYLLAAVQGKREKYNEAKINLEKAESMMIKFGGPDMEEVQHVRQCHATNEEVLARMAMEQPESQSEQRFPADIFQYECNSQPNGRKTNQSDQSFQSVQSFTGHDTTAGVYQQSASQHGFQGHVPPQGLQQFPVQWGNAWHGSPGFQMQRCQPHFSNPQNTRPHHGNPHFMQGFQSQNVHGVLQSIPQQVPAYGSPPPSYVTDATGSVYAVPGHSQPPLVNQHFVCNNQPSNFGSYQYAAPQWR